MLAVLQSLAQNDTNTAASAGIFAGLGIVAWYFLCSDTAEIFDKGFGWKLVLFLFPGIGHLILGFGSAQANPANMAPGVGLNKGGYGAPPAAPGMG